MPEIIFILAIVVAIAAVAIACGTIAAAAAYFPWRTPAPKPVSVSTRDYIVRYGRCDERIGRPVTRKTLALGHSVVLPVRHEPIH